MPSRDAEASSGSLKSKFSARWSLYLWQMVKEFLSIYANAVTYQQPNGLIPLPLIFKNQHLQPTPSTSACNNQTAHTMNG
ncbi:hypothetical protein VE03_10533 [Pseudogymnoascus sp. 23342-1-I1]|nr:hypothetical protein VE03_10533 [Pseudogymnoascus sp. 23342-1-I1]